MNSTCRVPCLELEDSNLDSIVLKWEGTTARHFHLEYWHIKSDCREVLSLKPGCPNIEVVSGLRSSSEYVFQLTAIAPDGTAVGPGPEHRFCTEGRNKCCVIS